MPLLNSMATDRVSRSPSVTMYNVSKKLVSDMPDSPSCCQVRFKHGAAYDGYAGVIVPKSCLESSVNPAFWHIRMDRNQDLTMTYKAGPDEVHSEPITPREFKTMFDATRQAKKKKKEAALVRPQRQVPEAPAETVVNRTFTFGDPDDDFPF